MERWEFMNGEMRIYEWIDGILRMERWVFMNGVMGIYEWSDGNL